MKIVIFGLAVTSSWGNGHATTYRALARALHARGHKIIFFERDMEWYASNRDLPNPQFCRTHIYERWEDIRGLALRELADAEVAMVGSYFPDGIEAIDEVLGSRAEVKAFYDIDTPITAAKLRSGDAEYLRRDQIPGFDLYFSFTGGPMLRELETAFGARRAVPLYCSFDPNQHRLSPAQPRFACDLSYMGTYAPDRQAKLEQLFCAPARLLPHKNFLLAGPQYPGSIDWPRNVSRVIHLEPKFHAPFYCSSGITLNLTRGEMLASGYSPSVRLFEAAGCGAAIVSDHWEGLETFFARGKEILVAAHADDVAQILSDCSREELRAMGGRARQRVLAEHTSEQRAMQFEQFVGSRAPAGQSA